MIPVSGSAYSYSYATLGEFVAWFVGWNLILEYLFAAATVAVGWSGYVVSLLHQIGMHLPDALDQRAVRQGRDALVAWSAPGALINLPAVLIIVRDDGALLRRHPAVGALQRDRGRNQGHGHRAVHRVRRLVRQRRQLAPVHPAEHRARSASSAGAAWCTAAGIIFFAYIGFDAVSTAAQEARNPQRDMPIGILGQPRDLHGALHRRRRGADRHGAVPELNTPAPVAVALDRYAGPRAGSPAG